jgi:hypothetical protein
MPTCYDLSETIREFMETDNFVKYTRLAMTIGEEVWEEYKRNGKLEGLKNLGDAITQLREDKELPSPKTKQFLGGKVGVLAKQVVQLMLQDARNRVPGIDFSSGLFRGIAVQVPPQNEWTDRTAFVNYCLSILRQIEPKPSELSEIQRLVIDITLEPTGITLAAIEQSCRAVESVAEKDPCFYLEMLDWLQDRRLDKVAMGRLAFYLNRAAAKGPKLKDGKPLREWWLEFYKSKKKRYQEVQRAMFSEMFLEWFLGGSGCFEELRRETRSIFPLPDTEAKRAKRKTKGKEPGQEDVQPFRLLLHEVGADLGLALRDRYRALRIHGVRNQRKEAALCSLPGSSKKEGSKWNRTFSRIGPDMSGMKDPRTEAGNVFAPGLIWLVCYVDESGRFCLVEDRPCAYYGAYQGQTLTQKLGLKEPPKKQSERAKKRTKKEKIRIGYAKCLQYLKPDDFLFMMMASLPEMKGRSEDEGELAD